MVALCSAPAHADEPDIQALLKSVDNAAREDASHAIIEMKVKTRRYERTLKMESWSKGSDKALIRILEPAKDKGVSTLKVGENLWNYLPNVDRTIKVPSAMMSGAWMGSHLSNDDLVRETRFSEDYDCKLTGGLDAEPAGAYTIACIPGPKAPVVYSKVDVVVRPDGVPVKQEAYDERGTLVRTMAFEDVREISGQQVAMTWRVVPHNKEGEYTMFSFLELELDIPIDDGVFSLQSLKK